MDDSTTIKELLDEFQSLDCNGDYYKSHQAKNYLGGEKKFEEPSYCSAKIKDEIFNLVPELGYSPPMLNTWIMHHIYKPLGYKTDYCFSYADVMNQFMNIDKKNSMIHQEMQISNSRDFHNMVIKTFEVMENASSDFVNNKG